ncbi:MAG: 50S ribosomal protein L29 [Candidatus Paceibacterota bacterium]|jgi:large subunit ribosomal protein L29
MKKPEFKQKTKEELEKILGDKRNEVQVLEFQLVSGKIKSAKELRASKKDIARILTILNQK